MTHRAPHPFICFALALAFALPGCASRPEERGDAAAPAVEIVRRKEIYDFTEKLTRVHIVNRYGDLRVRPSERNSLGVSAVIQRIGSPARDPELRVERQADSIDFQIVYAGDDPAASPDLTRGRIDLIVYVPVGAQLDAETDAGTLEVRRFAGAVRARTRSGALFAASKARIDAATVGGRMLVRQLEPGWSGDSVVRSDTGDIVIGVPTAGDYRLEVAADGGVVAAAGWREGELALPAGAPKKAQIRKGSGEPAVRVQTGGRVEVAPVILLEPAR